jgi:uncharacterized repeat protein (TIGR03803 family)
MRNLKWSTKACGTLLLWTVSAVATHAQTGANLAATPTFTVVHSFDGTDGAYLEAGLVQGTDGKLYGTTFGGGGTPDCSVDKGEGCGTVFSITPTGQLTTLYTFCARADCRDGLFPDAGLVQGTDGKFYGTTAYGGTGYENSFGTAFSITAGGKLTTLYSFCSKGGEKCTDGARPSTLVQGTDGSFYGTTAVGGTGDDNLAGTVFKITTSGKLTTLYNFCAGGYPCADGESPEGGLVLGTDGKFYGTTFGGGANRFYGTVFSITAGGTLTTLYSFCSQYSNGDCQDGDEPKAGLVQGTDGNLYGTTESGGNPGGGTVFKITPSGALTVLYNFCSKGRDPCPDGEEPVAGLVEGTDGNFYGTTEEGGINGGNCDIGCGTIFRVTPKGELTTLHDLCSQGGSECTDGDYPFSGLVQYTSGTFYGTAGGGAYDGGLGVVYSLSVGLGPFVATEATYGKVGTAVKILGTNLTGATSVTFNGTAATFTVKSKSEITTTVPTGATTGTVQVVTPGGTLSSNVPFRVK